MDEKTNKDQIERNAKRYPNSIGIGNWSIEVNEPIGFVVRNTEQPEEYHFFRTSNGWITGVFKGDIRNPVINAFNSRGVKGVFTPHLCDHESVKKIMRKIELGEKHKNKTINTEEKEELLNLLSDVI